MSLTKLSQATGKYHLGVAGFCIADLFFGNVERNEQTTAFI